jgi:hypothetical protein
MAASAGKLRNFPQITEVLYRIDLGCTHLTIFHTLSTIRKKQGNFIIKGNIFLNYWYRFDAIGPPV